MVGRLPYDAMKGLLRICIVGFTSQVSRLSWGHKHARAIAAFAVRLGDCETKVPNKVNYMSGLVLKKRKKQNKRGWRILLILHYSSNFGLR